MDSPKATPVLPERVQPDSADVVRTVARRPTARVRVATTLRPRELRAPILVVPLLLIIVALAALVLVMLVAVAAVVAAAALVAALLIRRLPRA